MTFNNITTPITWGSDPEFFVCDAKGELLPAHERFYGEKPSLPVGIPYVDGFQAEFKTAVTKSPKELVDEIRKGLMIASTYLKPGEKITTKSLFETPEKYLRNFPPHIVQFGCKPSLNAYGLPALITEDCYTVPHRTAGCHVHIGFKEGLSRSMVNELVTHIDHVAGISSLAIMVGVEDPRRRNMYGKPGEYRLTPYGFEYRVFSSSILIHPAITRLHFELVNIACKLFKQAEWKDASYWTQTWIRDILSKGDIDGARHYILAKPCLYNYHEIFELCGAKEWYMECLQNGCGKLGDDVLKNWGIRK